MFQQVVTAYRQLAYSMRKTAGRRHSAGLSLQELEERAAPAIDLLPPVQPPAVVIVAVVSPSVAPAHSVLASDSSVRADLFGPANAGQPEEPDELEQLLADAESAKQDAAREVAVQPQETDDPDADAAGAVIVEDMLFLPRAE